MDFRCYKLRWDVCVELSFRGELKVRTEMRWLLVVFLTAELVVAILALHVTEREREIEKEGS